MDFDNEKKYEEKPATEQSTGNREGHPTAGNGFQRDYRGRHVPDGFTVHMVRKEGG